MSSFESPRNLQSILFSFLWVYYYAITLVERIEVNFVPFAFGSRYS